MSNEYSLRDYGGMIRDSARFTPYLDALRRRVTPDSVVLDIGAGTGILSMLACQLGARRVFAVESSPCIEIGKLIAADVPGADRISWIQALSTNIDLPEQADIVVGDLHGTLPFHNGNIFSMADARKRHLKPGGRMLPQRDLLYCVPAFAPEEYRTIDIPWRENDLGLEMAKAVPYLANTMWRAQTEPASARQFLSQPALWGIVDYTRTESEGLDNRLQWTIERHGTVQGLYVWFDGVVDDDLGFSNSPLLPERVYGRAFFPLESAVEVETGDTMKTRMSVKRVQDNFVYRWDTTIDGRNGARKAAFNQSTFKLQPGFAESLQKSSAGHVPTLDEDGQVQRLVLERMDGTHALGDIARELMQRFPKAHPDFGKALSVVSKISIRYG